MPATPSSTPTPRLAYRFVAAALGIPSVIALAVLLMAGAGYQGYRHQVFYQRTVAGVIHDRYGVTPTDADIKQFPDGSEPGDTSVLIRPTGAPAMLCIVTISKDTATRPRAACVNAPTD